MVVRKTHQSDMLRINMIRTDMVRSGMLRSILLSFGFLLFFSETFAATEPLAPGRRLAKQAVEKQERWITADHSKFEVLKAGFKSGPEVTKACLSCHTEASAQLHKTIHWTWLDPNTIETTKLGKGGLSVNNF